MKNEEKTVQGVARNVAWREKNGYTVLNFRVEQIDNEGNVTGFTQVELRETMVKGTLVDGDKVEVTGKVDPEGILIPVKIQNLKTNACITKSGSNKGVIIFLIPFVFSIIGLILRPFEGAIVGFIAGIAISIFIFILLMVIYAFKR